MLLLLLRATLMKRLVRAKVLGSGSALMNEKLGQMIWHHQVSLRGLILVQLVGVKRPSILHLVVGL